MPKPNLAKLASETWHEYYERLMSYGDPRTNWRTELAIARTHAANTLMEMLESERHNKVLSKFSPN